MKADSDILQHIVYDFNDTEMMEALRPSIEEALPVQTQKAALVSKKTPYSFSCTHITDLLKLIHRLLVNMRCAMVTPHY